MSAADQEAKVAYAKKHNVHHLFELLAHRVLDRRPDDIYGFLRDQIADIEGVEKRKGTYDPTAAHHEGSGQGKAGPSSSGAGPSSGGTAAEQKGPKKITIGVFGLDNAGKTSLIACVGGEATKDTTPTVGFTPTNLETPDHHVCIYDLGGGATFRGIWPHYFHDCHGIMFVVDASDKARLAEAADSFKQLVQHEYIRGKPIVVYCNKRDLVSGSAVAEVMGDGGLDVANLVGRDTPTKIAACCAVKDSDDGVDEGADWLITTIGTKYAELSATVKLHCDAVKQAKKEKLEAQRRRVAEAQAADEAAAANKK